MIALKYPRTRDCITLYKGDAYPVAISDAMLATGWQGGQGVMWSDSIRDEFQVTFSDGLYGGFCLDGSNESSDQLISLVGSQQAYRYVTFCAGNWVISTRTFERYTWASRQSGPLAEIAYQPGDRLLFSLRGLWTKEDEWTLSSDPRGANTYYIGSVAQVPSADNSYYMVIQTSI